ncbi:MAG: GNAT family N-acetyltransferase [Desulfobacteraceae bacterium]|nr:MAG: GNAT family N-acetyltransferase [Desulfobacteraceae bacterium]
MSKVNVIDHEVIGQKESIMGKRGRFGKYGEIKRISRIRNARAAPHHTPEGKTKATRWMTFQKKKKPERSQITIEAAQGSDVEFIHCLSKKVFSVYGPYEDMLARWFDSDTTVTLLAFMEARPVGFAMLGRHQRERDSRQVAELLAIAVEPAKQKSGIGDSLIREIVKKGEELRIEIVVLHTALENMPAQRLFKKHGFTASEIKKGFYPQGQDALLMYKYMRSQGDFMSWGLCGESPDATNET